jgi:hypothetical protein
MFFVLPISRMKEEELGDYYDASTCKECQKST